GQQNADWESTMEKPAPYVYGALGLSHPNKGDSTQRRCRTRY
ncbi:MAG: hypothetical protein ACI9WU_004536, partial [Myxococcota bacterium]